MTTDVRFEAALRIPVPFQATIEDADKESDRMSYRMERVSLDGVMGDAPATSGEHFDHHPAMEI